MKVERCILHVLPLLCGCLASMVHSPAQSQGVLSLENFSERLAMLASTGDCRLGAAGGKTATVHVLDRRDTDAPAGQGTFVLLLMLNSMTYSLAVEASIPGIGTRQATCEALDDDQRNKAFN